jgi:hypothetical protein
MIEAVIALLKVLSPVNVSFVVLPTKVSVLAGKVNVVKPATAVATILVPPEVDPLNVAPPEKVLLLSV